MLSILMLILVSADKGAWMLTDDTDNLTGKRSVSAITTDPNDTLGDKPSLFMECRKDHSVGLLLYRNKAVTSFGKAARPVYLSFNGAEPPTRMEPEFWLSKEYALSYNGSRMPEIVDNATRSSSLHVEILTDEGKITATYKTNGTKEAYSYMLTHCSLES